MGQNPEGHRWPLRPFGEMASESDEAVSRCQHPNRFLTRKPAPGGCRLTVRNSRISWGYGDTTKPYFHLTIAAKWSLIKQLVLSNAASGVRAFR